MLDDPLLGWLLPSSIVGSDCYQSGIFMCNFIGSCTPCAARLGIHVYGTEYVNIKMRILEN